MTSLLAAIALSHSAPSRTLLALNKQEDTVSLIDIDSGGVRAVLKTGPAPNEVAVSPNQKTAAIADMGAGQAKPGWTMTFVDVAAAKVTKTVDLRPHAAAHGIVWLSDSRLVFTSHATNSVVELDVPSGKVVRAMPTQQEGTHLVQVSRDQKRAYAVNAFSGSVTAFDLPSGTVLAQIPTGPRAEGISLSPDGAHVACGNVGGNTVSLIDTKQLKVVHTIPNVTAPIRTIFTRDGKHLVASSIGAGALQVFSTKDWSKTGEVDLSDPKFGKRPEGSRPTPMNLWQLKNGNLLVVLVTSQAVVEVDTKTWKAVRSFPTGLVPDGIAAAEPV